MCRFFSKLDGTRTAQKDYDGLCLWIDCWIGFADVVIQSRKVEGRGIVSDSIFGSWKFSLLSCPSRGVPTWTVVRTLGVGSKPFISVDG